MNLLSLYSKIQLKIEKVKKKIAGRSIKDVIARERSGRSNPDTIRKEPNHGIAAFRYRSAIAPLAMTIGAQNFASLRLRLLFWQTLKIIIRFLALIFNDSSNNFLIFTRLDKDSVLVCNNSYCQYKRFRKKIRFYSKTAFAGVLICTIIATSVLYLFMPGKPRLYSPL